MAEENHSSHSATLGASQTVATLGESRSPQTVETVHKRLNLRGKGRPFTESSHTSFAQIKEEGVDRLCVLNEDESSGFYLVHYTDEDDTFATGVGQFRGVVFDGKCEPHRVVAASQPLTPEYKLGSVSDSLFRDVLDSFGSGNVEVTRAYEGTVLRLFYSDRGTNALLQECEDSVVIGDNVHVGELKAGGWYLATYKRVDGRKSRWSAKPFGIYFMDLFVEDYLRNREKLDKNVCYTFLLSHQENKIALDVPQNRLFYVMRWNVQDQCYESVRGDTTFDTFQHVEIPEFLDVEFDTLQDTLQGIHRDPTSTGFLVTGFVNDNKNLVCVKYLYDNYVADRDVRGNEPNLRMAYYHALNAGSGDDFRRIMSDRTSDLQVFDQELDQVRAELINAYQRRFIDSEYCIFPKEFFSILKKIHDENRDAYVNGDEEAKNEIVRNVLRQYNARVLNACVKFVTAPKDDQNNVVSE